MICSIVALVSLQMGVKSEVSIIQTSSGFELRRNGERYFVKGAGARRSLDSLVAAGGNSVRTWGVGDDTKEFLDECHEQGLSVLVGFWLMKSGDDGFSYLDEKRVREQFEEVQRRVREFRNHPAVLGWTLGNEMELGLDRKNSEAMWRHVEELANMVRREDPSHPVGTVVADMWEEKMNDILRFAPSLQFLGVNSYGGVLTLSERMKRWTKPYLITEFGPDIPQNSEKSAHGLPLEPDSTAKADFYKQAYVTAILKHPGRVLGSYAFYWDPAEVGISGWHSMHLRTGEKLGAVDVMHELWGSGKSVFNPCPRFVGAEEVGEAVWRVQFEQPGGGELRKTLYLISEDQSRFQGDHEMETGIAYEGAIGETFTLPDSIKPGIYRAVVVARNQQNGAAVWNTVLKK